MDDCRIGYGAEIVSQAAGVTVSKCYECVRVDPRMCVLPEGELGSVCTCSAYELLTTA